MPDEFYHNGLADPPAGSASSSPSMLEQGQDFARNWWNGLGQDMRSQAGLPQSELMRRFGLSALAAPMALRAGRFPEATVDMGMARRFGRQPSEGPRIDDIGPGLGDQRGNFGVTGDPFNGRGFTAPSEPANANRPVNESDPAKYYRTLEQQQWERLMRDPEFAAAQEGSLRPPSNIVPFPGGKP